MIQVCLNVPLALLATAYAVRLKQATRDTDRGASLMQHHAAAAEAMAWTHGLMAASSGIALPASIYVIVTMMALSFWLGVFAPMVKRIHETHKELTA